jgi:hypothetical protein
MAAKKIGRAVAATLIASASLLAVSAGVANASVAQEQVSILACDEPTATAQTQYKACADGYYKFEYRGSYKPAPPVTCYKFDAYIRTGTAWQFAGAREACTE